MGTVPFLFILFHVFLSPPFSSSSPPDNINKGSSLSVENEKDILISPNRVFSAGFYEVGENAFCFSIWYTEVKDTIVWMANRDYPVNGKHSRLVLLKSGNLELTDAGESIWSTKIDSKYASVQLQLELEDKGNLVLHTLEGKVQFPWQSFDSPTNTLLPQQLLTQNTPLISSRSRTNHSSGFYKLFFDNDNVLRLLFNDFEVTSVYWPNPWQRAWDVGRSTYNNTRVAVLYPSGYFESSDNFSFWSADSKMGSQRRLEIDSDGNLRVYSLNNGIWHVQWQAITLTCKIHGICGANSLCTYAFGGKNRSCSCIPGYKMKNATNWSNGCEPDFKICKDGNRRDVLGFIEFPHVEFYGFDIVSIPNITLNECKEECLKYCSCKGFQYKYDNGIFRCFPKTLLFSGYQSTEFGDFMYIRVPENVLNSSIKPNQESNLHCKGKEVRVQRLKRIYKEQHQYGSVRFMLWFSCAFGGFEMLCILFFIYKTQKPSSKNSTMQSYLKLAAGFTRFTYAELKKASRNFSEEIGRGGGGIVYKAVLSDDRVAAIKRLNQANQGEAEFLAEVSILGKLNHMNLIEIWGYCAEGKQRLLVYEYMKNGSLAENLYSNTLGWEKRYEIAVGTAKGLAYLHDECLEWVLHCDVKPQNILLDSDYQPKIADFGLSKILNRGGIGNPSFSQIRGTRGYMAPEWVFNLSITSKVDVYSYGIVILELIIGRSPTGVLNNTDIAGMEQRGLVSWVREKKHGATGIERGSWIEEIVDPTMDGEYDMAKMEVLVQVAMQCAEEEKDARPTMSQVVDMLLHGK